MANSVITTFGVASPNRHNPSARFVLPDTFIGLELELEPAPDEALVYSNAKMTRAGWKIIPDGSLRAGGLEFVFREPLLGEALDKAITAFFTPTLGGPTNWIPNERTSTHIHIDMSQESDDDDVLRNTMALYYILEPGIMDLVGSGRKWCGYCNTFDDSETSMLRAVMSGVRIRETFGRGRNRYFGLNPRSLTAHGTLEFRMFPNPRDAEELVSWVNLVMEIKSVGAKLAHEGKQVEEVVQQMGIRGMLATYGATHLPRVLDFISSEDASYRAGVCLNFRLPHTQEAVIPRHPLMMKFVETQQRRPSRSIPQPEEAVPALRTQRRLRSSPATVGGTSTAGVSFSELVQSYNNSLFRSDPPSEGSI